MPITKTAVLLLGFLLMALVAATSRASLTFSAGIENSQWYLSSSIFECSLTHNIPRYGRAVFFHEAGENLQFYLSTPRNPMRKGQAALVLEAPTWRPGSMVTDLGYVAVAQQTRPISVGQSKASQMMDSLLQGMMPTFTRRARFGDETIRVEVSSINFSQYYEDYLTCVAGLLPVNFRQVERTAVFFKVDEAVLSDSDIQALEKVILYVKADPSVTAIFVDGHTDVTGRRIYNRRLSKDRAEAVTDYLITAGISPEVITTRYHGERYPVVDNRKPESLARNRRTTVRLERGTKPPKVDDSVLDITEEGSF
ncbi:flagellar protein MotY [Hahella ganghwensis]|uniref:flagellar protein MotY n=1 Tax=Hahella ganghwensis TaxID=286420 RepID=UPI00037D7076|nr:OmpA family protein [Hahella ganghwensis]